MSCDMAINALIDAMTEDRCPICNLIDMRVRQAMDGFLYENVNDPAIRKKLKESRGLCNYHSTMLLKMGDPLAHALIYAELMRGVLSDVRAAKLTAYFKREGCFFCGVARECENSYSGAFYAAFSDSGFREVYLRSGPLCAAHLGQVLGSGEKGAGDKANGGRILDITCEKYEKLISQLEEIKRKNDYRFSDEQWSPGAKDAWKRAVAVLNDIAGLRK